MLGALSGPTVTVAAGFQNRILFPALPGGGKRDGRATDLKTLESLDQ